MKLFKLLAFLCILSLGSPVMAESFTIDFYPDDDKSTGNPISLTLIGERYKSNTYLSTVKGNASQGILKLKKFIDMNKLGDVDEIAKLWAPDERARVVNLLSDSELLNKNKKSFEYIVKSRLIAKIQYGQYTLYVVEHESKYSPSYLKIYPLVGEGEDMYMTNALSKDFIYSQLVFGLSQKIK